MASILTCPSCQGQLTLPEGSLKRIECPHCSNVLEISAQLAQPHDIPPRQYPPPEGETKPEFAPPTVTAAQLRRAMRPSNQPSALGQMAGILVGGALGMIVGYWILNYLGGPRFDFLHIPLPLVPHTQTAREAPPPQRAAPGPFMEEEQPPPRTPAATAPAALPPSASSEPALIAEPSTSAPTFPTYSSEQLGEALAAAHAAAGCENCQSTGFVKKVVVTGITEANGKQIEHKAEQRVPCEVCGGKPTGRINAEVYAKLCRLSERLTFVEAMRGDAQFLHRREAAQQVFLRASADREKQAAIGRLAAHLLGNRDRKENGILLAGTVQEVGKAGDYHWMRLVLFGLPEQVAVVSTAPSGFKPNSRVLLAGSIIDEPRVHLRGYVGVDPQVVLGGLPVPLPAEGR